MYARATRNRVLEKQGHALFIFFCLFSTLALFRACIVEFRAQKRYTIILTFERSCKHFRIASTRTIEEGEKGKGEHSEEDAKKVKMVN